MPLLLSEDYQYPLPQLVAVEQAFARPQLLDVKGRVEQELSRPEIKGAILPGQSVAVAVGSRGIRNLALIVKTTVEQLLLLGAKPFIVSAMGSHGSGTEEGQREVLAGYGITEEAMGIPVVTTVDTVSLGQSDTGVEVFFDRAAYQADAIVVINRIKLHTDFVADIQSGLCKMLVIGLGNHKGCSRIHEEDFDRFGKVLKSAAQRVIETAPVAFGIGIVENAYDETAHIEAIAAGDILRREPELVLIAKQNMPTLMVPKIDVLIVDHIGKDISGAGYDPNILGKSYILKEFVLPVPQIERMVLLDVTAASHGNAIGLGAFDVITKQVFDQLNFEAMYANSVAVKCVDDCKIPLVAKDEDEAVRVAIKTLRGVSLEQLRIVKIQSTLELDRIWVSQAVLEDIKGNPRLKFSAE